MKMLRHSIQKIRPPHYQYLSFNGEGQNLFTRDIGECKTENNKLNL